MSYPPTAEQQAGRAQLKIGGFKTTTVVVNGPHDEVRRLYEEVL